MAYKLNLVEARAWPTTLERPVDVDGAFRFAAILAAMRVIAPVMPGDGFSDHFDSDIYPPDFATADKYAVDAYRAMAALFRWDGGSSGASNEGEEGCHYDAIVRGRYVFTDIITRGYQYSDDIYELEAAAARGEVNSCLASAFPYRYWWDAYNRATYQLMHAWPLGEMQNAKWEPYYVDDESYVGTDYVNLNILPYSFAKTPSGEFAITVDDLLTYWMSHETAAELRKVAEGEPWLMTAEDIDFSGVFWQAQDDKRSNHLRRVWQALAHEVGFTNYASVGVTQRWSWREAMSRFWRGATEAKYANNLNLLAQLADDWTGHSGYWHDEFPYHGFAATLSYLDYFEQHNVGFAVESAGLDVINAVRPQIVVNKLSAETEEMTFELSLDTDFTVDVGGFGEPVLKREEPSGDPKEPYAQASVSAPKVSDSFIAEIKTDLNVVTVTYWTPPNEWVVYLWEHDEPFGVYMDTGNVAALGAALNQLAIDNITGITARGRFRWGSDSRVVTPPDDLDEHMLARELWDVTEDTRPVMFDNGQDSTVYFLRTTNSCRICRATSHALRSQLMAEADVPPAGEIAPLTLGDETITARFTTLTSDLIIATADLTRTIKIYNPFANEFVERPMPIISKRQGDGSYEQIFPTSAMASAPESGSADEYIRVGSLSAGLEVNIEDANEYETFSRSAMLETLRSLTFVRFPERVLHT